MSGSTLHRGLPGPTPTEPHRRGYRLLTGSTAVPLASSLKPTRDPGASSQKWEILKPIFLLYWQLISPMTFTHHGYSVNVAVDRFGTLVLSLHYRTTPNPEGNTEQPRAEGGISHMNLQNNGDKEQNTNPFYWLKFTMQRDTGAYTFSLSIGRQRPAWSTRRGPGQPGQPSETCLSNHNQSYTHSPPPLKMKLRLPRIQLMFSKPSKVMSTRSLAPLFHMRQTSFGQILDTKGTGGERQVRD